MNWTAEEIKLLGTKSDAEIAGLLDRSLESVRLKRQNFRKRKSISRFKSSGFFAIPQRDFSLERAIVPTL